MKKIITFAALIFGLTIADVAIAAPDKAAQDINEVDDLFVFDDDDFDSTTAFLNIDDAEMQDYISDYDNVPVDIDVDELISYAKQYLGRPYVWGSKGPKSFDCSGFTSFVFRKYNVNLSPASRMQATQGVGISKKDIRPGDLLFFQGRRSAGVGHVALAIDVDDSGDVTFIHAATGGVRIDKLSQMAYYQKRYICARRVIN